VQVTRTVSWNVLHPSISTKYILTNEWVPMFDFYVTPTNIATMFKSLVSCPYKQTNHVQKTCQGSSTNRPTMFRRLVSVPYKQTNHVQKTCQCSLQTDQPCSKDLSEIRHWVHIHRYLQNIVKVCTINTTATDGRNYS